MSLRFSSRVPNRGSRFGVISSAFVLKLGKNLRGAPKRGTPCLDAWDWLKSQMGKWLTENRKEAAGYEQGG